MTLNGAIMQLVEMRENSMMPMVFKPYFDKVIETISECEEPHPTHSNDSKDEEQHLLDDGTLVLYTKFDLTDVSRINVCQIGTHYGDLYYRDEDD